jgi:hypothetical protein
VPQPNYATACPCQTCGSEGMIFTEDTIFWELGRSLLMFQRNVLSPSLGLKSKLSKQAGSSNTHLAGLPFNLEDGCSTFLQTMINFYQIMGKGEVWAKPILICSFYTTGIINNEFILRLNFKFWNIFRNRFIKKKKKSLAMQVMCIMTTCILSQETDKAIFDQKISTSVETSIMLVCWSA